MNEVMTLEKLNQDNYTILNGKIINATTELISDNMLTFSLFIQGDGWQCNYGNFNLFDNNFDSRSAIADILKLLEKKDIYDIKDTYVRIAVKSVSDPVEYIGNIIVDSWFNFNDYRISKLDNTEVVTEEQEETLDMEEIVERLK